MARKRVAAEDDRSSAPPPARDLGLRAFAEVSKRFKSFRPARDVLTRVRSVPTIFPQLDHQVRVGGWPIERVAFVHGPSNHGKSVVSLGLGLSFLRRRHVFALVDAEMTTPITWLETLFGPYADSSAFVASRPGTYEEAVDDVKRVANGLAELREKGKVPPETSCLFVVDSIRKLVPEDIIARVKKSGAEGEKGSVDGYGGRAAQYRAALNAAWLDTLVPLMAHTQSSILFVGREAEDPDATAQDKRFGKDYRVTGGKALVFDSSLVLRVSRAGNVYVGGDKESGERGTMVGERLKVEVMKTKVTNRQEATARAYIHTSNGREEGAPEGFDLARDVLELGKDLGIVKTSGSWLTWGRYRAQGEARALAKLRGGALAELEAACRARSAELATKADQVGGEVAP